jgi:hypothetical protein
MATETSPSVLVRISRSTHDKLRTLAEKSQTTITALVDRAVEDLRREMFWDEFDRAVAATKADPEAWAEVQREDKLWEATLLDGLGPAEPDLVGEGEDDDAR